jgi:ribonuclease D
MSSLSLSGFFNGAAGRTMTIDFRTFAIKDSTASEDEGRLAVFLRTVEMVRVDTAYADGAWRVLVHYRDLRRKEERAQIESAIVQALNNWRSEVAKGLGCERDEVLSTPLMNEIARYAPTTELELTVVTNALGADISQHGAQIVQVVRQTMEDLTD